eukprot:6444022-Amphidinium_carterae.1
MAYFGSLERQSQSIDRNQPLPQYGQRFKPRAISGSNRVCEQLVSSGMHTHHTVHNLLALPGDRKH